MGFNKKVLSKAVSELDKAKAPGKPRDITVDPMGYWNPANQGKPVRVPGNDITMHNVKAPVWAQPNVGPGVLMEPEKNYNFKDASYVDETQIGRKGGTLKSHRYSKSMSATNKLFTKNRLFKNMKSKIFDPNAKFKSGGSKLGPVNLNPNPLSHYELNYGFNLPTKQEGGPQYTFPERDLYPEEDEYFSQNPHVGGMAAEDNHIIINPYSKLTNQEKDAIRQNEGARLAMRNGHPRPTFNLTDEQKENFKNYSQDEQDQRETIIGRIISGDPSVGKVSPEQQDYADQLSKLLKPGVNLKNTSGPRNNIIDDAEELELTDEEIQAYRDGGYVVEEIPHAQDGGPQNTTGPRAEEIPVDKNAMNAMMKARMAIENEFGNPAAQRMVSPNPKTYDFGNGDLGTHFMASMGNQAVPLLQDKGGKELEYNENPRPSKEDMRFRTPEEAQYFAKHYKDVAPMMRGFKEGGYVQHELVKAQKGGTRKPLVIADPKEFAYRDRAYKDSLDMYKNNLLATKYYDLATGNNPAYEDDFFINAKKGSTYIEKMKKIKKNSPAKFGSVFAKQKEPVQPVVLKQSVSNNTPIKSKNVESKKLVQPVKFVPKKDKPKTTVKVEANKVDDLPLKLIERFASPEQTIIPGKPYIKPTPNVGPRYGTQAGDENLDLPTGYTQQEREAARRKRDAQEFQRKTLEYQQQQRGNSPVAQMRKQGGAITESWEDELDDHTIKLLRKAGYTVEELD